MLFSELYSAYYNAVAAILAEAGKRPLDMGDIRRITEKYAFGESSITISEALQEERWQLIKKGWNSCSEAGAGHAAYYTSETLA